MKYKLNPTGIEERIELLLHDDGVWIKIDDVIRWLKTNQEGCKDCPEIDEYSHYLIRSLVKIQNNNR